MTNVLLFLLQIILVTCTRFSGNLEDSTVLKNQKESLKESFIPLSRRSRSVPVEGDFESYSNEELQNVDFDIPVRKLRSVRSEDSQIFPPLFPPSANLRKTRSLDSADQILPPIFPPSAHLRKTRSVESDENLLPPIFPPSKRSKRSSENSLTAPLIRNRRAADSEVAESDVLPPIFPPSRLHLVSRHTRSTDDSIFPPLFPPSRGWLHSRRRRSFFPPLFPPSSSRERRSVDDMLLPPLFPPSKRVIRSVRETKEQANVQGEELI